MEGKLCLFQLSGEIVGPLREDFSIFEQLLLKNWAARFLQLLT